MCAGPASAYAFRRSGCTRVDQTPAPTLLVESGRKQGRREAAYYFLPASSSPALPLSSSLKEGAPRGSTLDVEEQVRRKIRDLAPGDGYGLAASNSVPDYVKPENYHAMVESARRYGKYPIEA